MRKMNSKDNMFFKGLHELVISNLYYCFDQFLE